MGDGGWGTRIADQALELQVSRNRQDMQMNESECGDRIWDEIKKVSKKVNKSIELSRTSFHLKGISTNTKIPTSFDKSS